ncbi:MAG: hypothetical protein ACI39B_08040 [Methanobrevibacter smithii]|jgi:hypothetical protein
MICKKLYTIIDGELKEIQLFVNSDIGDITLECMSKEDYKNIDDIAGHEVCTDELIFLQPWYDDTEDLKERFGKI